MMKDKPRRLLPELRIVGPRGPNEDLWVLQVVRGNRAYGLCVNKSLKQARDAWQRLIDGIDEIVFVPGGEVIDIGKGETYITEPGFGYSRVGRRRRKRG
jgi:hypothetical protein